ncbi:MAG: hypothetical protein WCG67_00075 [Ferruginibacter sp.]
MNKRTTCLLLLAGTLFLSACQKNVDVFVPDPGQINGPDSTWYNSISAAMPVIALQNNLNVQIETVKDSFEISTASAAIVTTSNGVQCTFPSLCCVNASGVPVTGKVYLEILLVKKKGDMVLLNKPTSSNGSMLVTGGEIFIRLFKDGQEVRIAPNAKIYFRYVDVPIISTMKLFFGDESIPERFNWLPNTDTINNVIVAGSQAYEIATNHLHWINVDYFYDTTTITRSTVSAQLPSNYTNANTSVFLVFKEIRSVLRMNADVPERRFISGKVPNSKTATIVVLSKQGNDYYLGKESIITGSNIVSGTINQRIQISPIKTSLADIKTYLATL